MHLVYVKIVSVFSLATYHLIILSKVQTIHQLDILSLLKMQHGLFSICTRTRLSDLT